MPKKKTKQASGGARLVASGKIPMTLGLTTEERDLIRQAASAEGRHAMTEFVLHHALEAARKITGAKPIQS